MGNLTKVLGCDLKLFSQDTEGKKKMIANISGLESTRHGEYRERKESVTTVNIKIWLTEEWNHH